MVCVPQEHLQSRGWGTHRGTPRWDSLVSILQPPVSARTPPADFHVLLVSVATIGASCHAHLDVSISMWQVQAAVKGPNPNPNPNPNDAQKLF